MKQAQRLIDSIKADTKKLGYKLDFPTLFDSRTPSDGSDIQYSCVRVSTDIKENNYETFLEFVRRTEQLVNDFLK